MYSFNKKQTNKQTNDHMNKKYKTENRINKLKQNIT